MARHAIKVKKTARPEAKTRGTAPSVEILKKAFEDACVEKDVIDPGIYADIGLDPHDTKDGEGEKRILATEFVIDKDLPPDMQRFLKVWRALQDDSEAALSKKPALSTYCSEVEWQRGEVLFDAMHSFIYAVANQTPNVIKTGKELAGHILIDVELMGPLMAEKRYLRKKLGLAISDEKTTADKKPVLMLTSQEAGEMVEELQDFILSTLGMDKVIKR